MGSESHSVSGKISLGAFLKANSSRRQNRPFGNVPKRRSFLIVCEGEKTEPNYFRAIASCLPRYMVENVVVEGAGGSPDYLLSRARELVDARKTSGLPPFYNVWLVFDRDDFAHFSDTIEAVDKINDRSGQQKTRECPVEHWDCAWSNEAFEIWYVLHFREQLGGGVPRAKYQEMIEEDIRKFLNEKTFSYAKNDPEMFARLHPYVVEAIKRAERTLKKQIEAHGTDYASMNPATRVYELVRALLAYLRKGD